jgi:hypothetical protein
MRHLKQPQAAAALRRGKGVEQLLGLAEHEGRRTVRWVAIYPWEDGFSVRLHHVYAGEPDFLDIAELAPVDGDEDLGEGVELARHESPEEALTAARRHGATPRSWVNQHMIGDEYADARASLER